MRFGSSTGLRSEDLCLGNEVRTKIAALVKNLHDGCWLAYDDLSTVVLCPRCVRQGCESGPMIFNSIYQLATEAVKDKLRDEGIVISLPGGELWDRDTAVVTARERSLQGQSGVHHNVEEILDVYFGDDDCHMIAHKQAAELVKRMRLLVATIISIFSRFQFVNLAKGKTEKVMLALTRMQRLSEKSCEAPMACGCLLTMMRGRCIARCMSSLSTTWEHG